MVAILEKGQKLLEAKAAPASDMCRIYLKRIEHIYFKFDPKVVQQKNVSSEVKLRRSLLDPSGFNMNGCMQVRPGGQGLQFWPFPLP